MTALRHSVARITHEVAEHNGKLTPIAERWRQIYRAVDRQINVFGQRIAVKHLAQQWLDVNRVKFGYWKTGEIVECENNAVRCRNLPIDPIQVDLLLLGGGTLR